MALDLRPLSLGELFDRAFGMYRQNLWVFAGIAAVPAVLALAATLAVQIAQMLMMRSALHPAAAEPLNAGSLVTIVGLYGGAAVLMLAYWVVYMIALGATTFAVSEVYVGRPVSIAQVYRQIRSRTGQLIVLMLLIGLRLFGLVLVAGVMVAITVGAAARNNPGATILLGLLAFLTFGVITVASTYLCLRYSIAVPALVIERLKASAAIKRSIELTKGRLMRVFLLVLCALMVTYATMAIFQGPFILGAMMAGPGTPQWFWFSLAGGVLGTIGATFTTPFLIIGLALIYYDARIRDEGLDLELTLAAIDTPAGA
jgi:hypothetical protein